MAGGAICMAVCTYLLSTCRRRQWSHCTLGSGIHRLSLRQASHSNEHLVQACNGAERGEREGSISIIHQGRTSKEKD